MQKNPQKPADLLDKLPAKSTSKKYDTSDHGRIVFVGIAEQRKWVREEAFSPTFNFYCINKVLRPAPIKADIMASIKYEFLLFHLVSFSQPEYQ